MIARFGFHGSGSSRFRLSTVPVPDGSGSEILILDASRNPTSPSSASPCAQVPQDSANLAPTWSQNGTKNLQNRAQMAPRGAKMEPKWCQDGVKTVKNSEKNANATKKRGEPVSAAPFLPKKWPTWSQLGSQNGAKMAKKSIPKSIIFLMPVGINFWVDFGGFWLPKWSQVGSKMGSKIDVYLEGQFF